MRNLKLLNKKNLLSILFFSFLIFNVQSQEPVDIWNIEKKNIITNEKTIESEEKISTNKIYEMQSQKSDQLNIEQDQTLISKEIKIVGLYDPAENGLDINMWSNSNGSQILQIFKRINKIELSEDASEILNILLLTNAYYPEFNISKEEFFQIKSDWLIKKSNLKLIENYLINNQIVNENPKLTKYLLNNYLSKSEIDKSCQIFSNIKEMIDDEYLSKFKIYCLIYNDKKGEAQLLLDLKKEIGFADEFYEKKINYLMGYENEPETTISEKTILDFYLSHQTNPEFKFTPKDSTSKEIWKYLSTTNLLDNIQDVELTDIDKIAIIEKATHDKNYTENELFELYKRFQFNINQLLNIKESTKVLSNIEARALIYQGILITTEIENKIQYIYALKNSFTNDGIENAFNEELKIFLKEMDPENIPSKYRTFYNKYKNEKINQLTTIRINNKVLHQSKLINYFKQDKYTKNINKDLNDLLKKFKKNKKYFFSKKDIILIEALKSDGVKVSDKYKNLYKIDESDMPPDIQALVDNNDMAGAILRIVEVIGQDELKNIDADTVYFIVNTLNQLDADPLRNKILLKILPLKV